MNARKIRVSPQSIGWFALVLLPAAIAVARPNPQVLVTKDVSPDSPFGTPSFGEEHGTTNGRINGIAVDPSNDQVVYAASEWNGVWKSTDGAQHWHIANHGLRSGITQKGPGPVLAIDADSQRLVYLTQPKDGRPYKSCTALQYQCGHFGGLWVSSDAAASWQHVDVPYCAYPVLPNFTSVGFSGGSAFALSDTSPCRLTVSADPSLATWTSLPDPPFPADGDHMSVAPGPTPVLFACQGAFVWRSTAPQTPGSWVAMVVPNPGYPPSCDGIASVPARATIPPGPGGAPPPADTVVVSTSGKVGTNPDGSDNIQTDVFVFDFSNGTAINIESVQQTPGCCGTSNVFVAPYAAPGSQLGPGLSYDVYRADRLEFWSQHTDGTWSLLPGSIHVDTWSMAFPSTYDPPHGQCTGYATNDGGVWSGCRYDGDWSLASSGFHALWATDLTGYARPIDATCLAAHAPLHGPCPVLYLPTADNDQRVTTTGGIPVNQWEYANDYLGDAGVTFIDPAVPNMALATRNGNYHFKISGDANPPVDFWPYQDVTIPDAGIGLQDGPEGGLSQVMTLANRTFDRDDLFGLQEGSATRSDFIYRNETMGRLGGDGQWLPVFAANDPSFNGGMIGALAASGGHDAPTLYVLTTDNADTSGSIYERGKIYKGQFSLAQPTITPSWSNASGYGFPSNLLNRAYSISVNPYDPNEIYVTDLGDSSIRVSRDGGLSWIPDPTLKDIATNHGEFDFDCGNFPIMDRYYYDKEIFGGQCPLLQVLFLRDQPNIRVAVLYPGEPAFSRDYGHHWIPLDVTHAGAAEQPILLPTSAFYDPTTDPDSGNKNTILYVGLQGRSVMAVEGPFPTLESGRITDCPICRLPRGRRVANVTAVVDSPGPQNVPMHPIGGGLYQGDFAFDSAETSRVSYHIVADGVPGPRVVQALTPTDVSTGVVALTSLPLARVSVELAGTGPDWIGLRFSNNGSMRLATVELRGVEIERPGGNLEIPEHDFLGSLDPGASVSLTVMAPGLGVLGVRPSVHAVDDAGRDVVFDGNATTVRRGR